MTDKDTRILQQQAIAAIRRADLSGLARLIREAEARLKKERGA